MHPLLLKVRHELIICQCFFYKTHGTDWWWQENYTVLCVFLALSPINAFRVAWRLSSVIWWCGLLKSYIVHIVGICKGFIFHLNCSLIWYKIMFPFLSLQLFIPEFVWAKGHPRYLHGPTDQFETWVNLSCLLFQLLLLFCLYSCIILLNHKHWHQLHAIWGIRKLKNTATYFHVCV